MISIDSISQQTSHTFSPAQVYSTSFGWEDKDRYGSFC